MCLCIFGQNTKFWLGAKSDAVEEKVYCFDLYILGPGRQVKYVHDDQKYKTFIGYSLSGTFSLLLLTFY